MWRGVAAVSSILTVIQDHVSPSQLDTAVSGCCDWASFTLLAFFLSTLVPVPSLHGTFVDLDIEISLDW
jgi:hypothetical protein